jgi:hypothetical protein
MKTTQCAILEKLLRRKAGVTSLEIIQKCGTVAPHRRLADLKAKGLEDHPQAGAWPELRDLLRHGSAGDVMYGFVYCLDNFLAMPGLYKVGHTMKSPPSAGPRSIHDRRPASVLRGWVHRDCEPPSLGDAVSSLSG